MDYTELNGKYEYYLSNKHLIPSEAINNYENVFRIEYTHNSTAIEGNTLSLIETKLILEDKISPGGKDMRELHEVENHDKAFSYVKKCVSDGRALDENTVKDIHEILMENIFQGGIYRNLSVRITGAGFQPPPPNDMYIQVKNFYADLLYKKDLHPIELAAWTHAEFVKIHPFGDGNGRVSRMIMNYQLIFNKWLPVSIAKEDRIDYFNALEAYAVLGNIKPLTELIAELEIKELDKMIEVIEQGKSQ